MKEKGKPIQYNGKRSFEKYSRYDAFSYILMALCGMLPTGGFGNKKRFHRWIPKIPTSDLAFAFFSHLSNNHDDHVHMYII